MVLFALRAWSDGGRQILSPGEAAGSVAVPVLVPATSPPAIITTPGQVTLNRIVARVAANPGGITFTLFASVSPAAPVPTALAVNLPAGTLFAFFDAPVTLPANSGMVIIPSNFAPSTHGAMRVEVA